MNVLVCLQKVPKEPVLKILKLFKEKPWSCTYAHRTSFRGGWDKKTTNKLNTRELYIWLK